jgi:hypothetical protein
MRRSTRSRNVYKKRTQGHRVKFNQFDSNLKRYNGSEEQYNAQLAKQNGTCALCPNTHFHKGRNRLAWDHEHLTDEFRGLLCNICNMVVGVVENNPEFLTKLTKYLEKKHDNSGT